MSYKYAKFEENTCVGTDESTPFAGSMFRYDTFQKANNKGADQTARMRRLACDCVVRKPPKTGFLASRPILSLSDHPEASFKWNLVISKFCGLEVLFRIINSSNYREIDMKKYVHVPHPPKIYNHQHFPNKHYDLGAYKKRLTETFITWVIQ